MNGVFLTGRLTRDREIRSLASGKNVTILSVSVTATASLACRCVRPTAVLATHSYAAFPPSPSLLPAVRNTL